MTRKTVFVAAISVLCLTGTATVIAAEKAPKKLTCCEEAFSKKKECSHKCCIVAHSRGQSCVKCNPGKEDLKLRKDAKGTAKKTSAPAAR